MGADHCTDAILMVHAIEYRHNGCTGIDQWLDGSRSGFDIVGFDSEQHDVAGTDFVWCGNKARLRDMQRALGRVELQAMLLHRTQVFAARDEGDVITGQ